MSFLVGRPIPGFIAGFLAVLTFHQAMIGILHAMDVIGGAPFSLAPVPPFRVPQLLDLCFWGGVWGIAFALVARWLPGTAWIQGILLGIAAVLAGHLLVAPLKGGSITQGWGIRGLAIGLAINCFWGIGVALLLPSLQSGRTRRS